MSVTYAVEAWSDLLPEMSPIWQQHWEEVAMHRDAVPLDPDLDAYLSMERAGMLHIVAARSEGKLIGYHISIVKPHLHYRTTLHAHTDVYFVCPEFRQGMTGVKLFKEVERTLKARGVIKMITGTKLSLDMGRIFERLGWEETERTFTKLIG